MAQWEQSWGEKLQIPNGTVSIVVCRKSRKLQQHQTELSKGHEQEAVKQREREKKIKKINWLTYTEQWEWEREGAR